MLLGLPYIEVDAWEWMPMSQFAQVAVLRACQEGGRQR
jgi:hypothetical protein